MAYKSIKELVANPWEYNFELEAEGVKGKEGAIEKYKHKSTVERYLIYKSTDRNNKGSCYDGCNKLVEVNLGIYGNIPDCDGSSGNCALAAQLYEELWGWTKGENTSKFLPLNNEWFNEGKTVFGGDTMNSAQTLVNYLMEEVEKNNQEYRAERDNVYKKRKKENPDSEYPSISIKYCLQLYSIYNEKFVAKLEADSGLQKYLSSYHTLGNFVLVPKGFNKNRYSNTKDFWDSSLAWLKKFGYGSRYGSFVSDDFNKYINYFFLWDYVEAVKGENGNFIEYKIKPLFDSHDKIEEGKTLEESKKNWTNLTSEAVAEQFMENVTNYIKRRGIFMTALLRLKTSTDPKLETVREKYFEFIQGKKFLSDVHENGFKEASDELINQLGEINSDDAKKIRAELSMITGN